MLMFFDMTIYVIDIDENTKFTSSGLILTNLQLSHLSIIIFINFYSKLIFKKM